ncbi:MAG: BlaI/MecI/CopY family transcriptional regulator [Kangiellaceae bacterium]|nr:BlaI/MecI/CopY family transcriptional regulator [Kangiellaceae bacterium]
MNTESRTTISQSEKVLMDAFWKNASERSPITAKQIIEIFGNELEWHAKTVKTLLNRLLKKNAISYSKRGREYLYYPILKQEDYLQEASEHFLQRVFNGSVSSLVASFAKQEKLTDKDLKELKALIKEIEG